jgi:hypothetical protein
VGSTSGDVGLEWFKKLIRYLTSYFFKIHLISVCLTVGCGFCEVCFASVSHCM